MARMSLEAQRTSRSERDHTRWIPDLTVVVLPRDRDVVLASVLPAFHRGLAGGPSYDVFVLTFGDEELEVPAHVTLLPVRGRGYGDALRLALRQARGTWIAVLDEEFAARAADVLPRLWEARGTAGVVIGSRYVSGGGADMPLWRRGLSRALNALCRRGLSLNVRDLSSSCRLYRRDAVCDLELRADHHDVLEEVLIQINADGWPIREIPVRYSARGKPEIRALAAVGWSFLRTFVRMWQLRNSAFSADYDDRAFNSVIPLQRYWQRARHRIISGFLDPSTRTLDIGCGSSRIIQGLPEAVGLDIQLKKLRRVQTGNRRLVQATLTRLPFVDGVFQTVICSQVIEHIPRELVDFDEMNRVLAPGGMLIVGTPDYATVTWRVLEWAYGIVHPGGYVQEHINQYTAASLRDELAAHGFEVLAHGYVGGGELIYKARKIGHVLGTRTL
jgi:SAM-dependent methyltransferase